MAESVESFFFFSLENKQRSPATCKDGPGQWMFSAATENQALARRPGLQARDAGAERLVILLEGLGAD